MDTAGYIELGMGTLRGHRLRTALSTLGIAIGIASVILLTSIGEGTRRYLVAEFSQFGTNILEVVPGKTETHGVPGVFGGTTQKLSLDDAAAIARLPDVTSVVPMAIGQGRVEAKGLGRSVFIYGSTSDLPELMRFDVGQGSFLPPGDMDRGGSVVVLGPKVKREIFGDDNALGKFVRIAGYRLRVIGVMMPRGRILAFDIDDAVYVPVATAMRMFNLDELMEIDVLFTNESVTESVVANITRLMIDRHGGKEDFSIHTQTEMLEVFDRVMNAITIAVAAIAGISLLVGAIGVFTMMWITVGERIGEIGLLRALGATRGEIHGLFLLEAVILTLIGGCIGVALGLSLALTIRLFLPGLPVYTPPEYVLAALLVSALAGVVAGVVPARRAAFMDPVDALRTE